MADLTAQDLRAAVAAGLIDEAQAAGIAALAAARAGYRDAMPAEDEPFELFRGFNEVFITLGLVLLFMGIGTVTGMVGGEAALPLVGAGMAWGMAEYFTRRRRMVLPSVVLAVVFAGSVAIFAATIAMLPDLGGGPGPLAATFVAGAAAGIAFYRRFRVPITLFVVGVLLLLALLASLSVFETSDLTEDWGPGWLIDLAGGSRTAIATLAFGIATFVVAMGFDTRDPHRLSRLSACGFWLHLLAAPAIVNTVVFSLYNLGTGLGYALSFVALVLLAGVALVIDRRSFLTAGLLYLGLLLGQVFEGGDTGVATATTLLILGGFITLIGANWMRVRAALMRALPDFPLKDRLPPWEGRP